MFQQIFKAKKFDAFLISNQINIGYLSNFWGSFGYLLISQKEKKLFTDGRYLAEAQKAVFPQIQVVDFKELKKALAKKIIAFESENVTVEQFKQWQKKFPDTKFKTTQNIVEKLRIIKTNEEIHKIRHAAQINDQILKAIRQIVKIGITERELAWQIRKLAFEYGAEKMAFDSIVNFGKHTAHPHHEPQNIKLKKGDLILLDLGTKYQKYCSDITRVFFTQAPTKKQTEIFQIVLEAQKKAIQKVSESNLCQTIDQTAREFIEKKGYDQYFTHSLGHGVGLEIHESPSLSSQSESKLTENSIFTIEPGIYLPNEFGIRLEDLFLYKQKKAIPLSQFTKKMEELIIRLS